MPRLSIIVPHIAGDSALETTILSVLENRPTSTELIVAHAGNYRDPYRLDNEELRLVKAGQCHDLIGLINTGLRGAASSIVQILLPGSRVDCDWSGSAVAWFHDERIGSVSPTVVDDTSSNQEYAGLDTQCLPRRAWRHTARRGDEVTPTLCGGYYRKNLLDALYGWLANASREGAEAEMALAFHMLRRRTVAEPASRVFAARSLVEGEMGGYALGHFAGQLAMAYSQVTGENLVQDSLAARLGYLAGGLVRPSSVAERLGWVLGLSDRSLVASIRTRLEKAHRILESADTAASQGNLRRAA